MAEHQLKIYDGKEPYIFISYAHKDSEQVMPIICRMQQDGYRVWMDLGIEVGTEWSNNIAAHLRDCSVFLAFISRNSVGSENCLDEIAYAKSHKKDSIMVFLEEDVTLPDGTEMQTARFQRMYVNRLPSLDDVMQSINSAGIFEICRSAEREEEDVTERSVTAPPAPAVPKQKKWLIPVLAAVLAVVLAVGGVLLFAGKGGKGFAKVTMSDKLMDYTFSLEGVVYQLPFEYQKLLENGWTISSSDYSNETLVAGQDEEGFYVVQNGKQIYVSVFNTSGNSQKISQCLVGGIEVEVGSGVDFKIAKNVTPSASSAEIIDTFGTPAKRETASDCERLIYGEAYSDEYVEFTVWLEDGYQKFSSIDMRCYRVDELQQTETNEKAPDYLATYREPAALGSDFTSGIVEVDGDLYQLPAPVQKFLDNGWVVSGGSGFVTAGGTDMISLSRNDVEIDLDIANYAEYQTTPANCAVVGISEYGESGCVVLPGNIKLGLTAAEAEAATAGKAEKTEGTYSVSFSYYEYEKRNFSVYISVDKELGKVSSVSLDNKIWNYS